MLALLAPSWRSQALDLEHVFFSGQMAVFGLRTHRLNASRPTRVAMDINVYTGGDRTKAEWGVVSWTLPTVGVVRALTGMP